MDLNSSQATYVPHRHFLLGRTCLTLSICFQELVKIVLGVIDVSVIWFGYKQSSPTSGLYVRLLSLGLGWAVGHHVAYYLPGFWIDARSLQFSYTSTFEALSSVAFLVRQ